MTLPHLSTYSVKGAIRYGAVVDGKFVKFDKHGSELATEAIKKSDKKDNLRADITGEMKNGEIVVDKLEMNK